MIVVWELEWRILDDWDSRQQLHTITHIRTQYRIHLWGGTTGMLRKNITCNVNTMRLACAPGATEALLPHGEAIMCVEFDRSGCHCCDLLSPFSLRPERRQIAQAEPSTAASLKSPRSTVEVRIVKHALLCSHALLLATSLLYLFLLSRCATRFCCLV